MSRVTGTVQYMVLVRPVTPDGKVFRGLSAADQVSDGSTYKFKGEPWLVFARGSSLPQVQESAQKAAASVGSENVKMVKVIEHDLSLTIN